MPDAAAPAYRPTPDGKGKGVDPLESQGHQQSGDADPLLPSSSRWSSRRISSEEGLPLLEFGVVHVNTGDWLWKT